VRLDLTPQVLGFDLQSIYGDRADAAADGSGWGFDTELRVPSGSFRMGSPVRPVEQPIHTVSVPAFWMGVTQVTQAQWQGDLRPGQPPPGRPPPARSNPTSSSAS